MNEKKCEIESLNLDQLDVEELEHRLEMAVAEQTLTSCIVLCTLCLGFF